MFYRSFAVALWFARVGASNGWVDTWSSANQTNDASMSQASLLQTQIEFHVNRAHRKKTKDWCLPAADQQLPNLSLPLVLYQTYLTAESDLPHKTEDERRKWHTADPRLTMSYMDDKAISSFMEENFDARVANAFHSMPWGVMKADFWRYAVIYINGGLYADLDVVPNIELDSWFKQQKGRPAMTWEEAGCSMVLGMENEHHISNWAFAAVPKHPFLKHTIDLIVKRAEAGIDVMMGDVLHYHTGPGVFTAALNEYASATSKSCWGNPLFMDMLKMAGSNICIMHSDRWKNTVHNLKTSRKLYHEYTPWRDRVLDESQATNSTESESTSNPCSCYNDDEFRGAEDFAAVMG